MDYRGIPSQPVPRRGYFVADGAAALAAAVLAALSGVAAGVITVLAVLIVVDIAADEPNDSSDLPDLGPVLAVLGVILAVICGVLAMVYLLGSALLLLRLTAGRVLVILGAALTVPVGLFTFGRQPGLIAGILVLVPAATIVLTALPSTTRWVAAGRRERQLPR